MNNSFIKKMYMFEVRDHSQAQRKYCDTISEYIVINRCDIEWAPALIQRFCTKFLHPCRKKQTKGSRLNSMVPFYKFEKIDNRTFKYTVTSPNMS